MVIIYSFSSVSAGRITNTSLMFPSHDMFLGLILIFTLSALAVAFCSVCCVALLLFFAILILIVHDCTHKVVIIAMIAVLIARIISTH